MRKLIVLNNGGIKLMFGDESDTERHECMKRLLEVYDEVASGKRNADLKALATETCRILIERKWK